jgi:nucleoside 2-deoxyribosyltransferase
MRIYLACTVRGDRTGVEAARLAARFLVERGHDVLTTHLLDDDVDRTEAASTSEGVFERDVRWLDACDVLVAEASGSTFGVGFEVGYITGRAPHTGQRVVVLYDAARRDAISRLIPGNTAPGCRTFAYDSSEDIESILAAALA